MDQRVSEVIRKLDAFVPSEVADGDTTSRLEEILDGFRELPGRDAAMGSFFALLERYPEAEFGTPGPLVHELEALPGYESLLVASLERQPTELTVWMVSRILSSDLAETERRNWRTQLEKVLEHPRAPEWVKENARGFILHQDRRNNERGIGFWTYFGREVAREPGGCAWLGVAVAVAIVLLLLLLLTRWR